MVADMRLLALIFAFVALASAAAGQDHHPELERLRAAALQIPGAEVQEHPGFTMVIVKSTGSTIHYFSKPGHFAHPGMAVRAMERGADGAWYIRTNGTSFGPPERQPDFERWMAQFRELDRRVREDIYRQKN